MPQCQKHMCFDLGSNFHLYVEFLFIFLLCVSGFLVIRIEIAVLKCEKSYLHLHEE